MFIFEDQIVGPSVVAAAVRGESDAERLVGRTFAQRFRQRLWAEHLGLADERDVEDGVASAALWPDFSTPVASSPTMGVVRFDPTDVPFPPFVQTILEPFAETLRKIFDPASP